MVNGMDRVAEIVKSIRNIPDIGPDDDLHDAGLISIDRIQLRADLEDAFEVVIPDDDRFPSARTVRALYGIIEDLVQ